VKHLTTHQKVFSELLATYMLLYPQKSEHEQNDMCHYILPGNDIHHHTIERVNNKYGRVYMTSHLANLLNFTIIKHMHIKPVMHASLLTWLAKTNVPGPHRSCSVLWHFVSVLQLS